MSDSLLLQDLWLAGISYKKSDAAIRGTFAVSPAQYQQLLASAANFGVRECFLVSTCNRTEIYGVAASAKQLLDLFFSVCNGGRAQFLETAYVCQGEKAAQHLFEVGAGLDSQILGDFEILGQIKAAIKVARDEGKVGAFTDRLINCVLKSSKAIKTNTQLSGGTVSVSFAAIQYIRNSITDIANRRIAVVGAGKIGRTTCKNLVHYLGTSNITVINRTEEVAAGLATDLQLQYAPYGELHQVLADMDIVIVSTGAPEPIIGCHNIGSKPKLIFDLSVPCNVDVAVAALPGITLVNVDELSRIKDETLEARRQEVPAALAIIQEHIVEFKEWLVARKYVPVLKEVKSRLLELSVVSVSVNGGFSPCAAQGQEVVQQVINNMAAKMRRKHTPGCHYIEAINDYFAHHE
ncbi:MAG: glutamyl-tRNA reductase [Chitinophagia bacterium]|nr:glutamyl-tRNA reductase [Chitinophagia bacterium]